LNNREVKIIKGFENQDSIASLIFYREESFDYWDDEEDTKP
jgi:hypothetical protein